MGRTFHRHQSHRTGILSTDLRGRTGSPKFLEHRASSEVQPISCHTTPPGFQISIKKHGPSELNSSNQDSFRNRNSIGYLEYQPFFVHSKSKARRIEYSGLRAMSLAALETSSLSSSGVVTPSATSNTNLSLFTQSQRHSESSSRGEWP